MIELVSAQRCIACDKCIKVCPTNVFDRGVDRIPEIARQDDCQTCFQCEANCPVRAVRSPVHRAAAGEFRSQDEHRLAESGLLGSYREEIGWGKGRTPGARLAVGPPLPGGAGPIIS